MDNPENLTGQDELDNLELDFDEPAVLELPPIDFVSPGRFQINKAAEPKPIKQQPAADFVIGEEANLQRFHTPESAISHLLALAQHARRSLSFYTSELEPWLFAEHSVRQACQDFLLHSPKTQLRILLCDSSRIIQDGHPLIQLSHRLPSNFQIRKLNPEHSNPAPGFVIADDRGLLVYPDPLQPQGYALYNDVRRASQHQEQFNHAWDHSLFDSNLRSLPL